MPPESRRVLRGWKSESRGRKRLSNSITKDLQCHFSIGRPGSVGSGFKEAVSGRGGDTNTYFKKEQINVHDEVKHK